MTKVLAREMGIHVVWAGTTASMMLIGSANSEYCDEVIVTEDHGQIGDAIAKVEPSAIFGTQMERHVGKAKYSAV